MSANQQAPFDRELWRRRRARMVTTLPQHEFLLLEVADRLADRLADVNRAFPRALDLGAHHGLLQRVANGRGGLDFVVQCEGSRPLLSLSEGHRVVADEEFLPFAPQTFDLVFSALTLQATNDLPGVLLQTRHSLKPDGLFLAAVLGGETLRELRETFLQAEIDIEGGASPRVAPMIDLGDLGGLLQRAGFSLPAADRDLLTLTYPSPFALLHELRGLGLSNVLNNRRRQPLRRQTLMRACELYLERYGDRDGRIKATFEIFTLTGWAPHESQPQALKPGSARHSLAQALDSEEVSAGEAARPARKPV